MHIPRSLCIAFALTTLLALPGCKKNKKGGKEVTFEESQECKDFIAAVDKDCAAPSEANQGVCRSMKGSIDGMKKTVAFAKGKLTDDLKKARKEMCVTQLDAFRKSLQP